MDIWTEGMTWSERWNRYFENHPEVAASWGHQNGRDCRCTCPTCDPTGRGAEIVAEQDAIDGRLPL